MSTLKSICSHLPLQICSWSPNFTMGIIGSLKTFYVFTSLVMVYQCIESYHTFTSLS